MMPIPIRLLAMVALMGAAAIPAPAQQGLAFAGIPWRLPADSARARVVRLGYAFSRDGDGGDPVFTRADRAELTLVLQDGRAAGFLLVDSARDARAGQRYAVLADSLQAALGRADTLGGTGLVWVSGLSELRLQTVTRLGVRYVTLEWRGPGMLDEMNRRWADRPLPPLPPGFTAVTGTAVSRVAVDTLTLRRTDGGALRGRFRIDYSQPVGPDDESYDGAGYEVEAECAQRRMRLLARSLYLQGRARKEETFQRQGWQSPRPEGHYGRGLEALCRAAAVVRPR